MGRSRLYLIFLLCLFIMFAGSFPHEAVGDEVEEVVVTATRVETPVKEVGSSVTVITGDEMKKHGDRYLGDTLRRVAGISVTRSGGPGTLTSVYMRGLKSGNVLVLVNGVEVNDPSSISRDFDFGTLTVEDVERIEIIRGPQSVLYGSDAVGGVINIITKKGIKGRGYSLGVEYGSFETRSIQGSVRAGWSDSLLALTFSSHHTGGISVANASNGNDERDGFGKESITLNGETAINEHLRINFFGKYEETETDLDDYNNATFLFQDDLFYTQDLDRFTGKAEVSLDIFEGRFENIFGIMGTSTQRKLSDDPDSINPDWKRFSYWGKWRRVYYQGNYYLSDHLTLTGGIEAEEEKFFQDEQGSVFFKESISEKATRTESYFAQVLYASDFISGGAGARVDSHDRFGDELTYRLHASVNLGETGILLRASYGTGFKAPTLFQLFSKNYGDPNLKPEKTKGFDAGVEGDFLDGTLSGKFTWFYIDQKDLIGADPSTWRSVNIGSGRSKGFEVELGWYPADLFGFEGTYTYTDSKNTKTGKFLLQVPRHVASLSFKTSFSSTDSVGDVVVSAIYKGERLDFGDVFLPGYTVINLSASYRVREGVTLTGKVENLFDRDYEEVAGYGTPGISVYGGITLSL